MAPVFLLLVDDAGAGAINEMIIRQTKQKWLLLLPSTKSQPYHSNLLFFGLRTQNDLIDVKKEVRKPPQNWNENRNKKRF